VADRRGTAGIVLAGAAVAVWLGVTHHDPGNLLASAEQLVEDLRPTTAQDTAPASVHPVDVVAAEATLATLPVKGRAPKTGYSREQFGPAWADVDHSGCDQRNETLARGMTNLTFKPETHDCVVLTGTLADPYTGTTIDFRRGQDTSSAVQIDHRVPLANAWVTGAQQWDIGKREQFANDPLNLVAVDGPTNASKGDGDAATWLPPNKAYRCEYVAAQVDVKAKYGLWVTQAEHDAIARILDRC